MKRSFRRPQRTWRAWHRERQASWSGIGTDFDFLDGAGLASLDHSSGVALHRRPSEIEKTLGQRKLAYSIIHLWRYITDHRPGLDNCDCGTIDCSAGGLSRLARSLPP
jgi:hypothetical protein